LNALRSDSNPIEGPSPHAFSGTINQINFRIGRPSRLSKMAESGNLLGGFPTCQRFVLGGKLKFDFSKHQLLMHKMNASPLNSI